MLRRGGDFWCGEVFGGTRHQRCYNQPQKLLEPASTGAGTGRAFPPRTVFCWNLLLLLLHLLSFWILLPVIFAGTGHSSHCRRAFWLEPAFLFAETCYIDFFIWWGWVVFLLQPATTKVTSTTGNYKSYIRRAVFVRPAMRMSTSFLLAHCQHAATGDRRHRSCGRRHRELQPRAHAAACM